MPIKWNARFSVEDQIWRHLSISVTSVLLISVESWMTSRTNQFPISDKKDFLSILTFTFSPLPFYSVQVDVSLDTVRTQPVFVI